ncbi:MAG TPA: ATP-grasp domain-containing protein [Myxococcota bacterium]|nr:ATP-grasp domain-containing protein [Myxococcota bacterium]
MNVLFLSPQYPIEMQDFTRGLAEVGARVYGIGDSPPAALSPKVRKALADYRQISLNDVKAVHQAVRSWGVHFDRIECLWEPFVLLAAELREAMGIPGMSVDVVNGFRDKEIMKKRVEAAGLRVPHHFRARSEQEIWAAAEKVGYPLIIKPIAGAGSADTYRVDDAKKLAEIVQRTRHVAEVSVEEFVDGEEFTFDTVSIQGRPAFFNIAQYLPRPLVARTNEWISPIIVAMKDVFEPRYTQGIELGYGVLKALGMGTGFTHMEWYKKSNGEVVFGEIGCRVGGARLIDQMNFSCDIDLYREWARAVCWHSFEPYGHGNSPRPLPNGLVPLERKYNAAIIFKRALGQGKIRRIEGLDTFREQYGRYIVAEDLLKPGEHRRNWLQTLVSDGYLIVRHPDLPTALRLAEKVATDVRLYAG